MNHDPYTSRDLMFDGVQRYRDIVETELRKVFSNTYRFNKDSYQDIFYTEYYSKLEFEEQRNLIVNLNLALVTEVIKIINRDILSSEHLDDWVSIGTIGLIKAFNAYELGRKVKFATFASRCIRNEILMFLRKQNKDKNKLIYMESEISLNDDGETLSLMDTLSVQSDLNEVENQVISNECTEDVRKCIRQLSKRERQIIVKRNGLLDGIRKTHKQTAKELQLSKSRVRVLERCAKSEIRRMYNSITKSD